MKKYVLTGGPGTGKSTVLDILAKRGYFIVPEIARAVIDEEQKKGSDILPWENHAQFQEIVSRKQYQVETDLTVEEVFLDRGLVDGYAYSIYRQTAIPEIIMAQSRDRYDKVFFFEPLPVYQRDEHRLEDEEFAKAIHLMIKEAYEKFGYHLINVPVMPAEERVDFILNHL